MMWKPFLFSVALLVAVGHAQLVTTVDPVVGDTIAVTYSTDAQGITQATAVLSTFGLTTTSSLTTASSPTTTSQSSTGSSSSQTSQTTTLTSPLSSGTAQPPFPSRPVTSGSIIQYSQFTATGYPTASGQPGYPTTSVKPGSGAAVSTLQSANLYLANLGTILSVIIALMGGGGLWALW